MDILYKQDGYYFIYIVNKHMDAAEQLFMWKMGVLSRVQFRAKIVVFRFGKILWDIHFPIGIESVVDCPFSL